MLYIYQFIALIIGYIAFIYYETSKYMTEKLERITKKQDTPEPSVSHIEVVLQSNDPLQ